MAKGDYNVAVNADVEKEIDSSKIVSVTIDDARKMTREKFEASKSREENPKDLQPTSNKDDKTRKAPYRCTSLNVIRFKENDEPSLTCWSEFERTVTKTIDVSQLIKENAKTLERILKKALADSTTALYSRQERR
uniref:Uncharacterized protein n=1 Tax=Glossina pallidipes TaxID=7398 RepID=A0A1B0A4T7_GLOPL